MEKLCTDCPLRASKIDYSDKVEYVRARLDDADDRARVLALPEGDVLLTALSEPRPARCETLDGHLPNARVRHAHRRAGHIAFISCPELALATEISPSEYPEEE